MIQIEQILFKINEVFIDLGFNQVAIEHYLANKREMNFVFGNMYCFPVYIESLGFIIQYAYSLREAQHYAYDDGCRFPLRMGEAAILDGIRNELIEAISEINSPAIPIVADMKVAV